MAAGSLWAARRWAWRSTSPRCSTVPPSEVRLGRGPGLRHRSRWPCSASASCSTALAAGRLGCRARPAAAARRRRRAAAAALDRRGGRAARRRRWSSLLVGQRVGTAPATLRQHPALPLLPGRPGLHRGRGAAPPALRPRPDHQPGAAARDRHASWSGPATCWWWSPSARRSGAGPAGSGPRCWPSPWWPWPSSRCAAGWCASPTGSRYGAAATPYEALADLARRLGESPDPTFLLPAVAEAAGSAVSARRTTVRLKVPGAADQVGRWPRTEVGGAGAHPDAAGPAGDAGPVGATVEIPVVDRGETLGALHVEMPPGRDLRPARHPAAAGPGRPVGAGLPQRAALRRAGPPGRPAGPADRGAGRVAPPAGHGRRRRAAPSRAVDRP